MRDQRRDPHRARALITRYGERFKTYRSDLFETGWLPKQLGPFDAAVSSSGLHNLRSFERIGEIYSTWTTLPRPVNGWTRPRARD
jgi:hypothetical protein